MVKLFFNKDYFNKKEEKIPQRRKPYWYKEPLNSNIGYLFFFKRHSNIFIVITNYYKRHLYTVTSGNALLGKKKKEKLAVHNILKLVKKVLKILRRYRITYIIIKVKQYLNRHFFTFYNFIKKNRIYIAGFRYLLQKSHGFIKRRKIRRV